MGILRKQFGAVVGRDFLNAPSDFAPGQNPGVTLTIENTQPPDIQPWAGAEVITSLSQSLNPNSVAAVQYGSQLAGAEVVGSLPTQASLSGGNAISFADLNQVDTLETFQQILGNPTQGLDSPLQAQAQKMNGLAFALIPNKSNPDLKEGVVNQILDGLNGLPADKRNEILENPKNNELAALYNARLQGPEQLKDQLATINGDGAQREGVRDQLSAAVAVIDKENSPTYTVKAAPAPAAPSITAGLG